MKPLSFALAVLLLLAPGCAERSRPAPETPAAPGPAPAAPTAPEGDMNPPTTPLPSSVAGRGADAAVPSREWTAGIVDQRRPDLRPVVLRNVRAGRNEGFDRVVFEFEGTLVPGYHVEYIDSPVRHCGSGEVTQVAGQGWLLVRLQPAQAHTEEGRPTMAAREQHPKLPVVLELEQLCDFEGQVEWVLGNRRPERFRVMELSSPPRLVVDVQH